MTFYIDNKVDQKKELTHPEIFTGQLFNIEGEIYELYDMRVTAVESPDDFITSAFFRSKDPKSKNPFFEEAVKRMIGNPIFKRHFEPEKSKYHDREVY